MRETVSIMKACTLVGVSRRTIYNWMNAGKVEFVRTAGGNVRIFVDTLWRGPDGRIVSESNSEHVGTKNAEPRRQPSTQHALPRSSPKSTAKPFLVT